MLSLNMPTFNHMVFSLIDLSLFTIAAYQGFFHTLHMQIKLRSYQQKPYSPTLMCHLYTKHLKNIFLSLGVFIAFKGTNFYIFIHMDHNFILAIVSNIC